MKPSALLPAAAATLVLTCLSCATPAPPPARPGPASARARAASPIGALAGGGRVFVVKPVEGLGLYQGEARASLLAVAAWARGRGLAVVDPVKTWQVVSRARAGLSAATGAACGAPLPVFEALERWQPLLGASGKVTPMVDCDPKGCVLTVVLTGGLGAGGTPLAELSAPYPRRTPEPQALAAALAHLAPEAIPSSGGGLAVGIGGRSGPRAPHPEQFGWDLTPLLLGGGPVDGGVTNPGDGIRLADVLPGGAGKLRACFGANDETTYLSFTVGADGRVTRCEATYEIDREDACACRVLASDARLPGALRGDRFRAALQLTAAETVSAGGDIVSGSTRTYLEHYRDADGEILWRPKVSDPSIADWSPPADSAVDRCFADARGEAARALQVQVRFDAHGRPTGVRLTRTDGPRLTGAEAACLHTAFLASRAPCPATRAPVASAAVEVRFLPTPKTARVHGQAPAPRVAPAAPVR